MQIKARLPLVVLAACCLVAASCGGSESVDTTPAGQPVATTATTATVNTELGTISQSTDEAILALLAAGDIPSLAAAIVVGDQIVWAKGYGDQPELDTIYMAGSIDKSFVAVAVLQLVESGLVDLEADVGDYLPFPVRNPAFPDAVVTVESLLLHQAGLAVDLPDNAWYDNDPAMVAWVQDQLGWELDGDNPFLEGRPPLGEYLAGYFAPDGANAGSDIWIGRPGGDWTYSNIGVHHLARYLVENVSGQQHEAYVEEHILQPLGMSDTGFEAADYPEADLAIPYTRFDGGNLALPRTGMHTSGPLRTTAQDLARFLVAHMNRGAAGTAAILEPESIGLMHDVAFPIGGHDWGQLEFRGIGLGWWLWSDGRSGHGGNVPGYSARIIMQETGSGVVGVVTMVNVGCSLNCDRDWYDAHIVEIRELLMEEARSLL